MTFDVFLWTIAVVGWVCALALIVWHDLRAWQRKRDYQ